MREQEHTIMIEKNRHDFGKMAEKAREAIILERYGT
jgi:hypothetical protein